MNQIFFYILLLLVKEQFLLIKTFNSTFMKFNTISFCTVCMNRAEHVKQTLLINIKENYIPGVTEFIVLDYNSKDDLAKWVEQNMQEYIKNGALKFYKTLIPQTFHRSHSRNLNLRLGTGDLLCNVDADNFLGKGFAQYLLDEFNKDSNIIIRGSGIPNLDTLGRICIRKDDFYSIGGYDEYMDGYGAEDDDVVFRTNIYGRKIVYFDDLAFSLTLKHDDIERISNEKNIANIKSIFLAPISFYMCEFLILFNDKSYHLFTYTDLSGVKCRDYTNGISSNVISKDNFDRTSLINDDNYPYPTDDDYWISGIWTENANAVVLKKNVSEIRELIWKNNILSDSLTSFRPITDTKDFHEVIFYYTQIKNRHKLKHNVNTKTWKVNDGVFGCNIVFKNFDSLKPIELY